MIAATKVTIENIATAQKRTTTTNQVGFYLFPALLPGDYTLSAEAAGMQTWRGQLTLPVGQTAVVDIAMSLGSTLSQVTVAGDVTPLLTLNSATLANTLERTRIEELPLNGRFLQNLIATTVPGVEGGADAPKVNGLNTGATEFLQDGVNLANRDQPGAHISSRPTGHRYGAGIPGREQQLVGQDEPPGRNHHLHPKRRQPVAWLPVRNGAEQRTGGSAPTAGVLVQGAAPGAQRVRGLGRRPVYIPKVYNGRNRTFFFFAWEGYRNAQASTLSTNLPTEAMRQGDWSALTDGNGRHVTLYDPWTTDSVTGQRQPFRNNVIPLAKESPAAKYLYGVTPLPTMPGINPIIADNYIGLQSYTQRERTVTLRVDHRISERDQIFARYTVGKKYQPGGLTQWAMPPTTEGKTGLSFTLATPQNGVFSWIHTFSPTFFSETLVSGLNEDLCARRGERGPEPNLVADLKLANPNGRLTKARGSST